MPIGSKAVPPKWRDNEMISNALQRDPANLTVLADPAGFLNAHLKGHGADDWRDRVEAHGVAIIKNK